MFAYLPIHLHPPPRLPAQARFALARPSALTLFVPQIQIQPMLWLLLHLLLISVLTRGLS